jgi:hypothetical protein
MEENKIHYRVQQNELSFTIEASVKDRSKIADIAKKTIAEAKSQNKLIKSVKIFNDETDETDETDVTDVTDVTYEGQSNLLIQSNSQEAKSDYPIKISIESVKHSNRSVKTEQKQSKASKAKTFLSRIDLRKKNGKAEIEGSTLPTSLEVDHPTKLGQLLKKQNENSKNESLNKTIIIFNALEDCRVGKENRKNTEAILKNTIDTTNDDEVTIIPVSSYQEGEYTPLMIQIKKELEGSYTVKFERGWQENDNDEIPNRASFKMKKDDLPLLISNIVAMNGKSESKGLINKESAILKTLKQDNDSNALPETNIPSPNQALFHLLKSIDTTEPQQTFLKDKAPKSLWQFIHSAERPLPLGRGCKAQSYPLTVNG